MSLESILSLPREMQLCLAAGYIDGEVCLGISSAYSNRNLTFFMQIESGDVDNLMLVHNLCPCKGLRIGVRRHNSNVAVFIYRISGTKLIPFLRELTPYLLAKQSQAIALVEEYELYKSRKFNNKNVDSNVKAVLRLQQLKRVNDYADIAN